MDLIPWSKAVLAVLAALVLFDARDPAWVGAAQQAKATSVILTSTHRTGSLPVSSRALLGEQILSVELSSITNPLKVPFQISADLAVHAANDSARPRRVHVSSISPYPPDHGGTFEMTTAPVVRELKTSGVDLDSTSSELVLELRPLHAGGSLTSVQVTVGNLQWRDEEPAPRRE
jgi:hypothetical protein